MPLSLGAMLGQGGFVNTQEPLRAQIEWARIQDKPTDIELTRGDRTLLPQTVRIEYDNRIPSDATDSSGSSAYRTMYIFGVKGHPEIDDLDIDDWDTFVMDGEEYTVVSVNRRIIGQIQAYCQAVG